MITLEKVRKKAKCKKHEWELADIMVARYYIFYCKWCLETVVITMELDEEEMEKAGI